MMIARVSLIPVLTAVLYVVLTGRIDTVRIWGDLSIYA